MCNSQPTPPASRWSPRSRCRRSRSWSSSPSRADAGDRTDATADPQRGAEAATAKALELLGRRAHFRVELEAKLTARGFPASAVEAALERLAGRGYLDDRATARLWIEAAERKGYGPRRLRVELVRRGVDAEIAAEAISSASGADERERALAVAGRFRGSDPAALARHLDRKGFSKPIILEIVGKFPRRDADRDAEE